MPEIVSGAVPVFRSVEDCPALVVPTSCEPKARLVGVSVTAGAVPVPDRPSVCGLPVASSTIWTAAARDPVAVGVNVAEMPQLFEG